ncbi:MAG: N-6 DNA methylase, partial [Ruminococcus sp.]|nr:N-6 DNA methylase [Ruminococcus sp.]
MDEVKCTKSEKEMIKKLCEIRDITRKLIDLQKTSVPNSELLPIREELGRLYDEYKSEHGEINSKSVKKLFGSDSDFPILQSLEHYNKEKDTTEKADIFFRRTVNPMVEIKSVASLEEALQVSLDHKGKPDIPYMAILLDQPPEKVCKELLEKEQIFIDPEKELPDKPYSGVVERSEYLSGNVRMKLTIAEEYAKTNPEYNQNVNALKTVIPEDIKADEISVQMGCPWIEPEDYTAFLEHLSGRAIYNSRRCDVSYSPVTGEFSVLNAGSKQSLNLNETTNYGTADLNMYQLAEKILNQRRIVVQREKVSPKDPSKTVTRTDPKATKIALEKAKLIREEFKKWIFADETRKAKYERRYNDIFNSIVGREYDGSHLTFAGMTNDFTLRPHQKNCVARAIYGGNTLAAHVVGAGKSAVIFTAVMKKKELGLINKACVVVPKALTEQTANEWRRVYPDAKILTVTNDDLSNETKRNLFTAKVATGSYDAVILSQEQFEKIPMSKAYRVEFIQKEIDSLEDMLRAKKLQNNGKKDYSVKAIEKSKKQLQAKLEKLLNPKSASRAKDDLL